MCTTVYIGAYAQLNNSFFGLNRPDTAVGSLSLSLENLNYIRNLEYKSNIDEGRTLFGYQFWPELNYQIAPGIQVSAGVFAQRDFGGDGFYKLEPTYGLQIKRGVNTVRFGYLLGSVQHNLIEPLYDPERVIEQRMENGFQWVRNHRNLFHDFWIDWKRMTYQNSKHPEEFNAGLILEPVAIQRNRIKLSFPVSMLAYHQGGEIDTSHRPTLSIFNFDYAGKCILRPASGFDSIDLQMHFSYYEDISTTPVSFIDGLGQMFSAAVYFRKMGLMVNYWDAHQFQSPIGDVIYQSVSFKNRALYTSFYRKMLMTRIFYQTDLSENLRFLFRANYIRDLNQHSDNVVAEFYFRWTPRFYLGKLR